MIHEFHQQLPVDTPLGPGDAILIRCGEHDNFITVILRESRAWVTFKQEQIKSSRCYTMRRNFKHEEMREIIERDVK